MPRISRSLTTSSFDPNSAQPPEAVAMESDIVVILAALLCAIICILGLFSVARCAWLRRRTTTTTTATRRNNNNNNNNNNPPNKGIKKKIVQKLPTFIYTKNQDMGKVSFIDCAICLSEYVDGDEIRVLPHCGHGFHVGCIDTWLGSHSSCPTCRQILSVSRCRKCGEIPVVVGGGGVTEVECKGRQHGNNNNYLP